MSLLSRPPRAAAAEGPAAAAAVSAEPARTRGRRRLPVLSEPFAPVYVVWELTLLCDQRCGHCGSRAARAREDELTEAEALAVVPQLAAMGASEVVLIGGEAYLHPGFLSVVRALREAGLVPVMTTGGRGIDAALAARLREAGLARASVSIDGLGPAHDQIRGRAGSFASACQALDHLRQAGMVVTANTTVQRLNLLDLEALYEVLRGHGIRAWQVQLMAPLGRAADRPDLLLQPWQLIELVPRIAALKARGLAEGILLTPANNLGYFGPEEAFLRSASPAHSDHFAGCQAGRFVLGIESQGDVKGCPSLQSRAYVGGNLRRAPLADIWRQAPELAFTRARGVEALWGFCRACPFAAPCMGGCSFTAHAFFGRPGNNPYCHYRARHFAARGLRERLELRTAAADAPFASGLFEIVVEPMPQPDASSQPATPQVPQEAKIADCGAGASADEEAAAPMFSLAALRIAASGRSAAAAAQGRTSSPPPKT